MIVDDNTNLSLFFVNSSKFCLEHVINKSPPIRIIKRNSNPNLIKRNRDSFAGPNVSSLNVYAVKLRYQDSQRYFESSLQNVVRRSGSVQKSTQKSNYPYLSEKRGKSLEIKFDHFSVKHKTKRFSETLKLPKLEKRIMNEKKLKEKQRLLLKSMF